MSEMELTEAAKAGNASAVRELLESGADVNQQDKNGWTALNWAAGGKHLETVKLLLEHGADVFKVGTDLRTPRMIALAVGHAEVVKLLREAEDQREGDKPERPERSYARAYHLSELRQFPGWDEGNTGRQGPGGNGSNAAAGNGDSAAPADEIVLLYQDYTVSRSISPDRDVIFDRVTPEWKDFCDTALKFQVPDDLDLIGAPQDAA